MCGWCGVGSGVCSGVREWEGGGNGSGSGGEVGFFWAITFYGSKIKKNA